MGTISYFCCYLLRCTFVSMISVIGGYALNHLAKKANKTQKVKRWYTLWNARMKIILSLS